MKNLFTSDLHLGHRNICKYRLNFSTSKDHDNYMLGLMEAETKRTILHILGDFLFKGDHFYEYLDRIAAMPLQIKLLLGNHDSIDIVNNLPPNIKLLPPLLSHKKMWLSHCPIHPKEFRGKIANVHGHLHLEHIEDPRYINVNIDVNNYKFLYLNDIKNRIDKANL